MQVNTKRSFYMMISFIKGKKLSKPTWPYMNNELPTPVKSWKNCD